MPRPRAPSHTHRWGTSRASYSVCTCHRWTSCNVSGGMRRYHCACSSLCSISSSSSGSPLTLGLRDKPSAALCFISETCRTVKSKSWIQAIQHVTKASGKSLTVLFNWAIRVFASTSKTNWTSYRYFQHFLSIFNTPRHSCFPASYPFLTSDQSLLS